MADFKVGDRVVSTREYDSCPIGTTGVVSYLSPARSDCYYRVTLDQGQKWSLYCHWYFREDCLELYCSTPLNRAVREYTDRELAG